MEKERPAKAQEGEGKVLLDAPPKLPDHQQHSLYDFLPAKEHLNKRERTIFLLAEGLTMRKIATILGDKYDTIKKRATKAVRLGILAKEPFRIPSLHQRGGKWEEWLITTKSKRGERRSLGGSKKKDITTPHRFGVQYYLGSEGYKNSLGLPGLRRRYHLSSYDERDNLHAVWDRRVVTVWVVKFVRGTPQDKIRDGLRIAQEYADAHNAAGARLRFKRLLGRIEWIVADKPLSDYLVRILGLKRGQFLQIGQAQWGLDKSHPENLEINKLVPFADEKPTEYVNIMEFLLDREKMLTTIATMKRQLEEQGELNVLLEQKLHMLEAKIEGKS